jgi:hypothetical protein
MFDFGRDSGQRADIALGDARVYRCADSIGVQGEAHSLWTLLALDHARMISELRYGETPSGFRAVTGPTPLDPGCYIVEISGTGRTRMQVLADRHVHSDGRPW